jgi:hypothetical protein
MVGHRQNNGRLFGGVDVNTDRINLAIINNDGKLIGRRTFWFQRGDSRGFPRHSAWSVVGMRVHELLDYAYNNGVKTLFLEDPEVLGRLRLVWARNGSKKHENYDHKVSIFRSTIIEKIAMKAPLYGMEVSYVNPREQRTLRNTKKP